MTEMYYRYEDTQYAGSVDEFGDTIRGDVGPLGIRCRAIPVLRRTKCGVILAESAGSRDWRFVNEQRIKCYAHPTKEAALVALIARRERQASIYRARATLAEKVARVAHAMLKAKQENFYGGDYAQRKLCGSAE